MTHPLDPLSPSEITLVARTVNAYAGEKKVTYNTITLLEPPKEQLQKHLFSRGPKPPRKAEAIVIGLGTGQISEVIVAIDGNKAKVEDWKDVSGVQPTITLEDLNSTEEIIRKDPGVIEQCRISGVTDMSSVYCDPWTIGYDERWYTHTLLGLITGDKKSAFNKH
jgi:primary-amine oxidase